MLVSVVIPTYNRPDFLREALASVFAQTHKQIEVIVVDDGSTYETGMVLDELADKLRSIRLSRSGIHAARNTGLEAAKGEFLAFLDHDDLWHPTKLEKHLDFATSHPETALTYTDAIEFSKDGPAKISYVENSPALKDPQSLFGPMITDFAIPLMSATMIKTSFLKEKCLRFPNYFGIDDLGLFLLMLIEDGQFAYLPERLTMRRMHESNTSGNHRRRFEQRKLLYRDLLETDKLGEYRHRFTPKQTSAIKHGLRDATYRVAECDWEAFSLPIARAGFLNSIDVSSNGMRAIAYAMLTLLPSSMIAGLRRMKAPT